MGLWEAEDETCADAEDASGGDGGGVADGAAAGGAEAGVADLYGAEVDVVVGLIVQSHEDAGLRPGDVDRLR